LIKQYCDEYAVKDYLFYSTSNENYGQVMSTISIRKIVNNLFKRANLDMNMLVFHSLRHTSCEMLLEDGMPLQDVSEFMRHKNISTTIVYSKELNHRNSVMANNLATMILD